MKARLKWRFYVS